MSPSAAGWESSRPSARAVGPASTAGRDTRPVVWFDFAEQCEAPTSSQDVLTLVDRYPAWIVSGVPPLASRPADAQHRFVNLIDILHDRDITLTLVCDVPPDALLDGQLGAPDTERTASRLQLLTA
jgi:cell division protein ZapE